MTFPVSDSANGAWSGALTINGIGWTYPYFLYAIPLDPFNDLSYGDSDARMYAVVEEQ
jgi:hypothetical protein